MDVFWIERRKIYALLESETERGLRAETKHDLCVI